MNFWPEINNFQPHEFDSPDAPNSGLYKMRESTIRMADKGREISEVPWIITSGYRTPKHNRKIGAYALSSHILGCAFDVKAEDDYTRCKIIMAAQDVGFTRIGIGKNFIHLDNDEDKNSYRFWHYYPKPILIRVLGWRGEI